MPWRLWAALGWALFLGSALMGNLGLGGVPPAVVEEDLEFHRTPSDARNPPETTSTVEGEPFEELDPYQVSIAPNRTADPREVYARRYLEGKNFSCESQPSQIMTKEYEVAGRSSCFHTEFDNFGHLFFHRKNPHKLFFWMDIFKSGSSTMKKMLSTYMCPKMDFWGPFEQPEDCLVLVENGCLHVQSRDITNVTAFAVVRHPVKRFISGLRTVNSRMQEKWRGTTPCRAREIAQMEEPERFKTWVNYVTTKGIDVFEEFLIKNGSVIPPRSLNNEADILSHLMSQLWFISRYPGKIHYLLRLEDMHKEIDWLFHDLIGLQKRK
mmetsp:Transcript_10027/g.19798  ORF Transcript_10027/g.19798 Transcript_10027/m.19798 type:complete len:324 (+) Transcript_10027:89-1060(+)